MSKIPIKASRRFSSEKSAKSFAKKVHGTIRDLREIKGSISNFKVVYEQKKRNDFNGYEDAADFNSSINMNGMHWHTSEDL